MSSNFHPDGTLFIVSGPSGAGKTTLINRVREQLEPIGINLYFSVSHTTRATRAGEIGGESYHFLSRSHFDQMIDPGEFIELAFGPHQHYGASASEVVGRIPRGRA